MIGSREGCRAERSHLRAYVEGDASGLERLAFERHAEDCEPCSAALRFALELERELHRLEGSDFDRGFEDRIIAAVDVRLDAAANAAPDAATPARSRRATLRLPLAAAAAIVIGWLFAHRGTNEPEVAPASQPVAVATAPGLAPVLAAEDRIDPERLAATKRAFANALVGCANASDLAQALAAATADFKKRGWPVDTLLVAAIDDPSDDVARAAVHASAALRCNAALPALLRADRRATLRADATRALGPMADAAAVRQLERRLDDPAMWAAAIDALASCPRPDALRVLETAARDSKRLECASEARLALVKKGDAGARALLQLAVDGDGDAARVLGAEHVVDARLVLELLATPRDSELAVCALDTLPENDAIAFVVAHQDALRNALDDDTYRRTIDDCARQSFELASLACAAVHARPSDATAWIDMLTLTQSHGAAALQAMFADASLAAAVRAEVAIALASSNRLDSRAAFDAALAALTTDPRAAATLLCCAVRAGHAGTSMPGLAPKLAQDSFRTARLAADRWKADGHPPLAWERDRIAQKLAAAIPRL